MRLRSAFTLIELLVVIAIMVAATGLLGTTFFSKKDSRHQAVVAAANELAATCRQARTLAMARRSTCAVVFNIQNEPTSSGRVLNNRGGGHWYRLLGPRPTTAGSQLDAKLDRMDGLPDMQRGVGSPAKVNDLPYSLGDVQRLIDQSWVGEVHALPRGKVRFLALTDMDYGDWTWAGDITWSNQTRVPSATASYPRPWFGWYDPVGKRLYPWGGYDASISDASGFYFWGTASVVGYTPATRDPQPTTCTNTATRTLNRWAVGQISPDDAPAFPAGDVIYTAGSPRPLINALWRDASLVFDCNGEVSWGGWLRNRRCDFFAGAAGATERCYPGPSGSGLRMSPKFQEHSTTEAGNFEAASGGWYITIGPDADNDNDSFPTAQAALDSMMPMYRVFVSALGDVRVVAVSRSLALPAGWSAFPATASWWQAGANIQQYFPRDSYLDGTRMDVMWIAEGSPQGQPITDAVTVDMLSNRSVWMK